MWPDVVVMMPPLVNDLAGIVESPEPMFVQTIVSECSVEAFYKRILHWLAGLNEV
jgi:hypothetical protein|tara:strand:- start:1814 stop:1978 length:165 start_codon:yes stop_codon:yes gene_type:complete